MKTVITNHTVSPPIENVSYIEHRSHPEMICLSTSNGQPQKTLKDLRWCFSLKKLKKKDKYLNLKH